MNNLFYYKYMKCQMVPFQYFKHTIHKRQNHEIVVQTFVKETIIISV